MKRLGSILALVILSSCSSSVQKYNYTSGADKDTFEEWAKPFVHATERAPSSEIVSRPQYHWEADSLKIPVTANTTINQSYNVKFNQFSVYSTKEKVEKEVTQLEERWTQVSQSVLVCDEQAGGGKSELWDAFYSAPAARKQATLAAAIQGIGPVSATALVRARYFNSKPRNWNDFEDEIERAARAEVITKSVEYQVLYQYRSENMVKLGYNTQLSGVCHLETRSYYSPTQVPVTRKVLVDEVVTHRDLISSENRTYEVRISNQRLQSFESEMLIFNFNHGTNQVTLAQAAFNNYSIALQGRRIVVVGIGRKTVSLPRDVLPAGATLERSGGQASFTARVNRQYVPATAADGYLMISIQVHSCKKGMLGGCAVMGRDEQVQTTVVIQAISSGLVNHTFPLNPSRKYWVEYWANTANSPWYTNNVVKSPSKPEI